MFEHNIAYEASAGSGKTFMLVVRYLSLLYMGADPSKILALTFTNKAANEMQERIAATLKELPNRGELAVIASQTGLEIEELLKRREKILENFLKAHTKIMTIDSFFVRILRKFSLYVSLMPDFNTAATQHETKLLLQFLKEVDVHNRKRSLVSLAIESKKRLFDLFTLLDDFYIRSVELGAFEFKKSDPARYEKEALQIVAQMHTMVCDAPAASKDALRAFDVKNIEELLAKSKSWLGRETLEYRTFSKCYTPQLDELLHRLYRVLNDYFSAKEQNFFFRLKELSELYQKAKKALFVSHNEISFNDVTMLVYELMHGHIQSDFLYFRLDSTIEHILLDEFQDTSILQYEILHPLIREALAGHGAKEQGSFFFVGDKKQSIYRFRGGVSALFDEVAKINGTKVKKLTTNYRSKEKIVAFVNETFRDKIAGYTDQQVLPDATGGYVEVIEEEAPIQSVEQRVSELLQAGAQQHEIAILCATNADGEVVREHLAAKGFEVVTETTVKLTYQRSVKALLEYLKYLYFKADIFKYNFYALIQKELPVAFVDFNTKEPVEIVKEAVERFELFDGDFNILRFLEVVALYSDIEELLFEHERIQSEAVAASSRGIKVLTIHKSKGLEYPHVIVMDRLGSPSPSRQTVIYDYRGIRLEGIFLRIAGRDKIDKRYMEALQRNKSLEREDLLNALYVAFTRAKTTLHVIKKPAKSMFELLELTPKRYGEFLIETGKEEPKGVFLFQERFRSLYYGSQSDLLDVQKERHEDEVSARNFGVAMHYLLEMMEEFSHEALHMSMQMLLNRYGLILEESEIASLKQRIEMLLAHEAFMKLVGSAKGSFKEKALKYKGRLFYLDLLLEHEDHFSVIDYKSGTQYHEEHRKQVHNYKEALRTITKKPVKGYLCYLLENKVELIEV